MFVLPSPGRGLVDIQGVCNLLLKDGRFSKQQTTVDELKDAFNVFDKSGDGMVSVQDLRYVHHGLGSTRKKSAALHSTWHCKNIYYYMHVSGDT